MSAFTEDELDYRRIDVTAIVSKGGLVTITLQQREGCLAWLQGQGYDVMSVDCSGGMEETVRALGRLLRWEEQFGYLLEFGRVGLDALNDGFAFEAPTRGGTVLDLYRPDVVWREDPRWLLGLLSIAQGHCRFHLALGRRFFTVLVLPETSPIIGQVIERSVVPTPTCNRHVG